MRVEAEPECGGIEARAVVLDENPRPLLCVFRN